MYQTSTTLLVYASVVIMLSFVWQPAALIMRVPVPRFDVSAILFMLLTVFALMDLWVTPIPFRMSYIALAVAHSTIIAIFTSTFLSLSSSNATNTAEVDRDRSWRFLRNAITLPVLLTLGIAFLVLLYARAVYLWIHREKLAAALKTPPLQSQPTNENIV